MRSIRLSLCSIILFATCFQTVFATSSINSAFLKRHEVQVFIDEMVSQHGFKRKDLSDIFMQVTFPKQVIKKSNKPAEAMTWERYKSIVVSDRKVKGGIAFWKKYKKDLVRAHKKYGVPIEVIVATIGVESAYGQNTGKYRVIDSLTNLAFNYPRREKFFKSELKEYLLLTKEMKLDPLELMGSYAGAIGQPQFMPSSYRRYAVDFSGKHYIDLVHNEVDVIGSIGNFYNRHGWHRGDPIASPAGISGNQFYKAMSSSRHPKLTLSDLQHYGVIPEKHYFNNYKANLISLKINKIDNFWVTFDNFYAIKRYNPSTYYAMAIFQLSQKIKKGYESTA